MIPLPIIYGYPDPSLFEEADAGRVQLGGCVVTGDDPQYACPACQELVFESEAQEARYRQMWPLEVDD